jgi:hypothetical protein
LLAWLQPLLHTAHTYRLLSPLQISDIITITDKWAWLVRHSTGHCMHMESVDTRLSLIFSQWGLTKTMLPVMAEEYSSLTCNKIKNSSIPLQTNQQWKLFSETALVWGENIQDNDCELSVHSAICLIYCHYTVFDKFQPQLAIFTACIYLEIITTKLTWP